MEDPISRVYNCYLEGPESPVSAACQAAVALSGPQHLYDWNAINQLPNGNHQAFVPDGQLCSGGKASHAGQDLARDDRPSQPIAPDANGNFEFVYRATAPHSTRYFDFYVTKDGYDPTKPLAWSDLEATPFCTITSVTLENGRYRMNCALPQGKEGKHLIYSVWQRDDSAEAFYACIDVEFDSGMPSPSSTPQPPATSTPPTATPTVFTPPTATLEPSGDLCQIDYVITTDLEQRLQRQYDHHKPRYSAHSRLDVDVDLPRQPDDLYAVERELQPEWRSSLCDQRQLDRYDSSQWRRCNSRFWGFVQWGQCAADRFCAKRGGLHRQWPDRSGHY